MMARGAGKAGVLENGIDDAGERRFGASKAANLLVPDFCLVGETAVAGLGVELEFFATGVRLHLGKCLGGFAAKEKPLARQ